MGLTKLVLGLSAFVVSSAISMAAYGQSNPRYIRFAGVPSAVKGALFTPDAPQKPPHVAILVMHWASNFLNTPPARSCPSAVSWFYA
ncbi:MAG: hypothetical protein ABIP88_10920 [Candidatus Binatia bacterium]